jgi:Fur family ferric uptake transcriptional regulator
VLGVPITPAADLTGRLRAAGVRPTTPRRVVLATLIDSGASLTAQELHHRLRQTDCSVSLSTVYRTLHLLAEVGVLHTFARDAEVAFRWCGNRAHHHLICRHCGRIDDVEARTLDLAASSLADAAGYLLQGHRTDLYGICSWCRSIGAHARNGSRPPGDPAGLAGEVAPSMDDMTVRILR